MGDIRNNEHHATLPADESGATTVVLLIRHAHTDALGRFLAGRAAGVPLSTIGRAQAERLGQLLAALPLAGIYTSPLERAVETARAIARHHSVPIHEDAGLQEIDFGEWTGRTFAELDDVVAWHTFNDRRSAAAIPAGETPAGVQERIVGAITRLTAAHRGRTMALVTHADVIRSAVLYIAGSSLDLWHRFEVSPASITGVSVSDRGFKLLYVNHRQMSGPLG
jgi:broad specificity phosphatase PhoE